MQTKKALMASAVAGLLSIGAAGVAAAESHGGEGGGDKAPCYGVNKCAGTGACGGKHDDGEAYSCAGNNKCKGKGFLMMDKDTCLKIQGGRLTPEKDG